MSQAWTPTLGPVDPAPESERRRSRRASTAAALALNITAMIDVVFLLMTYFLLTAQFNRREESIPHVLPEHLQGTAADRQPDAFALPRTPVVIVVRSTGDGPADCAIQTDSPLLGELSSAADLLTRARARRADFAPDQRFIIRAAPDSRWEHALGAFNAIRRAGWTSVQFANPSP